MQQKSSPPRPAIPVLSDDAYDCLCGAFNLNPWKGEGRDFIESVIEILTTPQTWLETDTSRALYMRFRRWKRMGRWAKAAALLEDDYPELAAIFREEAQYQPWTSNRPAAGEKFKPVLNDAIWAEIAPLLPQGHSKKFPARLLAEACLLVSRTGYSWVDVGRLMGVDRAKLNTRVMRWYRSGILDHLAAELARHPDRPQLSVERVLKNSTIASRARQKTARPSLPVLTDDALARLIKTYSLAGNPGVHRPFYEAVIEVYTTGCRWPKLKEKYPNWKQFYMRAARLRKLGSWKKAVDALEDYPALAEAFRKAAAGLIPRPTESETFHPVLSDALWAEIEPILPGEVKRKTPPLDRRLVVEACLLVSRKRYPWARVVALMGLKRPVLNSRVLSWAQLGVLDRVSTVLSQHPGAPQLDPERCRLYSFGSKRRKSAKPTEPPVVPELSDDAFAKLDTAFSFRVPEEKRREFFEMVIEVYATGQWWASLKEKYPDWKQHSQRACDVNKYGGWAKAVEAVKDYPALAAIFRKVDEHGSRIPDADEKFRPVISDALWAEIKPLLPKPAPNRRYDPRLIIEGCLLASRTGYKLKDVASMVGVDYHTLNGRILAWDKSGILDQVAAVLERYPDVPKLVWRNYIKRASPRLDT
jgi:transposase